MIVPSTFLLSGLNISYGGHIYMELKKSRGFFKNLFWQEMFDDKKRYCQSCPKCQKETKSQGWPGTINKLH